MGSNTYQMFSSLSLSSKTLSDSPKPRCPTEQWKKESELELELETGSSLLIGLLPSSQIHKTKILCTYPCSPTVFFFPQDISHNNLFFLNEMDNKAFSCLCSNHPTDLDISQRKSQNPNDSDQLVSLCLHVTPPILTLVISDLAPKRSLSHSVPVTWGSLLSLHLCTFYFPAVPPDGAVTCSLTSYKSMAKYHLPSEAFLTILSKL